MTADLRDATRYREAIVEMVEAYGEMEKGIEDPILCHYNGMRLHNAMEDLRALVLPDYTPKHEPAPAACACALTGHNPMTDPCPEHFPEN